MKQIILKFVVDDKAYDRVSAQAAEATENRLAFDDVVQLKLEELMGHIDPLNFFVEIFSLPDEPANGHRAEISQKTSEIAKAAAFGAKLLCDATLKLYFALISESPLGGVLMLKIHDKLVGIKGEIDQISTIVAGAVKKGGA